MTNFWGSKGERYQCDIFYNDICVGYTDYIGNKLHWSQVFDWLFYTSYKRYLLHILFTLLENELSISEKKKRKFIKEHDINQSKCKNNSCLKMCHLYNVGLH